MEFIALHGSTTVHSYIERSDHLRDDTVFVRLEQEGLVGKKGAVNGVELFQFIHDKAKSILENVCNPSTYTQHATKAKNTVRRQYSRITFKSCPSRVRLVCRTHHDVNTPPTNSCSRTGPLVVADGGAFGQRDSRHDACARGLNELYIIYNITSFYGSSCVNNGKGAPNTPE
eukprot:7626415-Pyramimonas_sp.AAC.1